MSQTIRPMSQTIRHILAATGLVTLTLAAAVPATVVATTPVAAQGDGLKQIDLTQKQIDELIAAQPEINAAQQGVDPNKPDPKLQAKLESIVKKHGFSSLDNYGEVADSVGAVMGGFDPEKKSFVGQTTLIKQQIAAVQADKSMKAQDKAEALKELKGALAGGDGAKPPQGNIDLVAKNYDKLAQAQQGEGGGNQ